MKTKIKQQNNREIKFKLMLTLLLIVLVTQITEARKNRHTKHFQVRDTLSYTEITAKIIDINTEEPIVFASVFQTNENLGTVSNVDGEFVLKIPRNQKNSSVSIHHLGYKNKEITIDELKKNEYVIPLEAHIIPIDELVVTHVDPEELIEKALRNKKINYSLTPEMQTGFYRETIKQNRSYVAVSEAVLDIYNSGYSDNFDFDRVQIYKGRKSKNVKRMDTVLVKLQGGPRTAMFLDLVKNPGAILDPEIFAFYSYSLEGITKVNDRNNYVISFNQRLASDYPLYKGNIYIDMENYAITSIDFQMSELSIENAPKLLIKKKPVSMKVDFEKGSYRVNYRQINNVWVLNYVRSELAFKIKWDKKLFKSNINTMFEMAITDRDTENIKHIPYKSTAKFNEVLTEQVSATGNGDFWGEYNYIKPDESIETAIKKLNKKIKR